LHVEQITDKKGLREFVDFPFKLYRGDPNWVPPFIEERRNFLNPRKNPFFEHARCQLFLARVNGELAGTVGAVIDDNHNRVHSERMGAFGFFESIDNQAIADALLQAAEEWGRAREMTIMRGPLNFSTIHECGLLIEGFDQPPMVMMPYNPRYYPKLIEDRGYRKAMDLFAYVGDLSERWQGAPPKVFRAAHKAAQREGIHVRTINIRNFAREVQLIKDVYNRVFTRQWGFLPMTEREFDHLAKRLKAVVDPHLILVAETEDGTPIGVSIALPDLHQALTWSGAGHMLPFGLLKFFWYRRKISQVRLILMGVVEEYRGCGIDAIFYVETARAALKCGYKRIEGSWILENNTMMNRISKRLGMECYKTYRIYERSLW
jgi:hypothetical protein